MPERCTEACWTPVPCPECGNPLPPRGRSAPLGSVSDCCDRHRYDEANKRHLWSEHDEERWRFFPDEAPDGGPDA